jgi:hypothetical protein
MTTATIEKQNTAVEYQEFTWQAIEKMADAIGVRYYKDKDRYHNYGRGFSRSRSDKTLIRFAGGIDVYGDNNHTRGMALRYHREAFFLKIELYCLKNNLKYEFVNDRPISTNGEVVHVGMRIIK